MKNILVMGGGAESKFLGIFFEAIIDMISSKFCREPKASVSNKKSKPNVILPLYFSSKMLQDMEIAKMLRGEDLLETLPKNLAVKFPTVVFSYSKTIRSKICNYRQAQENINVDDFIEKFDEIGCECANSKFIDPHHKHVITGDLSIITLPVLRYLMQNGPNFREQPFYESPNQILGFLRKNITKGIENWAKFEGVPIEAFGEWKVKLLCLLKNRLQKIFWQFNKNNIKNLGCVLGRRAVIDYLKEFHKKYVITLIDKTTNNFAIICKKFYISKLLEEVGSMGGGLRLMC